MTRKMLGINLMNTLGVCLFAVCFYFFVSGEVAPAAGQEGALTLVSTEDSEEDSEVKVAIEENGEEIVEGQEKLGVFHPSKDWKKIKPGQAIPAGLHIRMDLQTGEKEAKLLDGDDGSKYWKSGERQGMVNPNKDYFSHSELKQALKDFKTTKHDKVDPKREEEVLKKFQSYKDLKKEFEDMHIGIKTDAEIITDIFSKLNSSDINNEEKGVLLEDLEFYLHQIDNAQMFSDMGGMTLLVKGLNDSDSKIKRLSAFVIGSAVQSNPKVQIAVLEAAAMQQLIRCLTMETDLEIRSKMLYAVSALIRHFPYAQKKFLELGGMSALKNLLGSSGVGVARLQIRAVSLIQDLVSEQEEVLKSKEVNEKVKQYGQVRLKEALIEQGACETIPRLLDTPDHDSREKILSAMQVLQHTCSESFQQAHKQLTSLHSEYQELAAQEEQDDKYFDSIVRCITDILASLPRRDEL